MGAPCIASGPAGAYCVASLLFGASCCADAACESCRAQAARASRAGLRDRGRMIDDGQVVGVVCPACGRAPPPWEPLAPVELEREGTSVSTCTTCGAPVPPRRRRHCSRRCYLETQRRRHDGGA